MLLNLWFGHAGMAPVGPAQITCRWLFCLPQLVRCLPEHVGVVPNCKGATAVSQPKAINLWRRLALTWSVHLVGCRCCRTGQPMMLPRQHPSAWTGRKDSASMEGCRSSALGVLNVEP